MDQEVWEAFRNCPRCGAPLRHERTADGPSLICSADGLVFFQNPQSAVSVALTNTAGEVLLLKRDREPYRGSWDFPGGFVNWGEGQTEAIVREVREELNVLLHPGTLLCAAHDWYPYQGLRYSVNALVFRGTFSGDISANHEIQSMHWVHPSDLPTTGICFPSVEKAISLLRNS